MPDLKSRLLKTVSDIQKNDIKLREELQQVRSHDTFKEEAVTLEGHFQTNDDEMLDVLTFNGMPSNLALETIVLRVGRPVLSISHDEAILQFNDAESQVWKERLLAAKQQLIHAARAVGRIELQNDPSYEWVGTGWLVDKNMVVTNRHVAQVFGSKNGAEFVFRQGAGGQQINAFIDFLEEFNRPDDLTFKIIGILHIEDETGPDLALLRVELSNKNVLSSPILLSAQLPAVTQQVAVIGYPARDSRIPDQKLMTDIFGDVYNKKRLAPGQVTGSSVNQLLHDCSTLGGNSGSVVLNIESGEAVGLHFAGRFLENNFAVPAAIIKSRIDNITRGFNNNAANVQKITPSSRNERYITDYNSSHGLIISNQNKANFTIPLYITISVGEAKGGTSPSDISIKNPIAPLQNTEREEFFTEAVPEDYTDRTGYDPHFLGRNNNVPLPKIQNLKIKKDVLSFGVDGKDEQILKYQHFSVVMSKSRRLCFFSAVNIDGKTSVPMKRGPWRLDPRIPEAAQIMKECYGNAPKFSRGHMTRREDPIWGDDDEAIQGNADSMHVTNTVPQMQAMNAGIWLKLENYALQNARKDDMRICVFTGPVFTTGDPVKFGVSIPLAFWKVIAFIHDETKKLSATGYSISQEAFLQEEEFIFGKQETNQVSISSIEQLTGLSFGELSILDPFEKGIEIPVGSLKTLEQIRFF